MTARSRLLRSATVLVGLVAVAALVGCSDDDEPEVAPATTTSTASTSSTSAADDQCAGTDLMDARALGVDGPDRDGLARAVATELLGWSDATTSPGERPCTLRVTSPSHELPVDLEVRTDASGAPRLARASSVSGTEDPALGLQLLEDRADTVTASATCPTCTGATVHVPYAGGVASVDTGLPVEATLDVPDGASQRGVVLLLRSPSGVEAIIATSVPDGDFAAG
jgi:hypothetical protein